MISPKKMHTYPSTIMYTISGNNMMDTNRQSKIQTKRKSMAQYEKQTKLDLRQKALKRKGEIISWVKSELEP